VNNNEYTRGAND